VDDHSSDTSEQVCRGLGDPRIRFHHRPSDKSPGANACRQFGIERARAPHIIFLDSDDLLAPFSLRARVLHMERRRVDFAVFPGLRFRKRPGDEKILVARSKDPFPLQLFLNFDIPWATLNPIWRTQSLRERELRWDSRISCYQDVHFHVKALLSGMLFDYVDSNPDCFWRENTGDNISGKVNRPEMLGSTIWFISDVLSCTKHLSDLDFSAPLYRLLFSLAVTPYEQWSDVHKQDRKIEPILKELISRSRCSQVRQVCMLTLFVLSRAACGLPTVAKMLKPLLSKCLWRAAPRHPPMTSFLQATQIGHL
jgi:glycosyltransferase involved in cell wall biosynthesis